MTTTTLGADRAIITPCGRYFDLGGVYVTRDEFLRMTALVRQAFLTDPQDEAAQAEFDEICERGIARASTTPTAP